MLRRRSPALRSCYTDAMDVLPGLDTFVLLCRLGSTAAAAEALGVPRSTVSRRVAALEERTGQQLLLRTPRGFRPTDAGAILLERGEPLLTALRALEGDVRDLTGVPQGLLRVAAPPGFGAAFVSAFLVELRRRWPALRLEMRVREAPPNLLDEDLDIVLCEGPLPDSPWFSHRIGVADRVVVASPTYLAARGPVHRCDLGRHEIIALTSPNDRPDAWPLRDGGVIEVSPAMVTADHQVVSIAVRDGLGIALLPLHIVGIDLMNGALVHVLPEVGREASILALTAQARRESPKIRAFFDLVDEFAQRFAPPHPDR
jgi:DNA-binding transcriptional LysR family regulator